MNCDCWTVPQVPPGPWVLQVLISEPFVPDREVGPDGQYVELEVCGCDLWEDSKMVKDAFQRGRRIRLRFPRV